MNYDTLSIGGYSYKYNLLPTLNYSGYQIDEGVPITRDGIGFQVSLDRAVRDIIFTLSHSQINNRDTVDAKSIVEYYFKSEYAGYYLGLKALYLNGGVDPHFDTRKEVGAELHSSFRDIEATVSVTQVTATSLMDSLRSFLDTKVSVQFPVREIFRIYGNYTRRSKEVKKESPGIEWYGVGIKFDPTSRVFFELWGGKEKGGLLCSGGVCRWVAPFDGIKLKMTIRL